MKSSTFKATLDNTTSAGTSRRAWLGNMALAGAGVGLAALVLSVPAEAAIAPLQQDPNQKQPQQPEAENGQSYKMPKPVAKTEKEFRQLLIGPATLSKITSELAIDKAANAHAKEFGNFELREAIAVTDVLKSLKTPQPPMDAMAKATLQKIQTSEGAAFDMAYITAQLENHEYLRDLATDYLKNSANATTMPEMQGRHLATLALATFKEHVVICKNILKELG